MSVNLFQIQEFCLWKVNVSNSPSVWVSSFQVSLLLSATQPRGTFRFLTQLTTSHEVARATWGGWASASVVSVIVASEEKRNARHVANDGKKPSSHRVTYSEKIQNVSFSWFFNWGLFNLTMLLTQEMHTHMTYSLQHVAFEGNTGINCWLSLHLYPFHSSVISRG